MTGRTSKNFRVLIGRVVHVVDRFTVVFGKVVGYAALLVIVIMLFYEVIARYVFNRPTQFTLEVGLISQVVLLAAATAYVLMEGGHVSIELITERISPRARNWAISLNSILGAILCLLLCVQVWRSAAWSFRVGNLTDTLEIPIAPLQFFMFGGFVLLGVQFLFRSYRFYVLARNGEKLRSDENADDEDLR